MQKTPPSLFDQSRWAHNRDKAAGDFPNFAFMKILAATRLAERLDIVRREFDDILDYGCHSGQLGQALPKAIRTGKNMRFIQSDVSSVFVKQAAMANPFAAASLVAEGEVLPIGQQSCDAILSALYLHWMNDLPGLLAQMRLALRPDGLLIANLLGGRSLHELRSCLSEAETEICGGMSPRCMPMADIKDMGGLLQRAGFALPVADAETLTITYSDMFSLMRDLRGMGGQNALIGRAPHFTRRDIFRRAAEFYHDRFQNEAGEVTATIELITITGWAPDKAQPRPLAPSQAHARIDKAFD